MSLVCNIGPYDDSATDLELHVETATHALAGKRQAACALQAHDQRAVLRVSHLHQNSSATRG